MKKSLNLMKSIITFALFLGFFTAFGQNKKFEKIQFGLSLSQELTFTSLTGPNRLNLTQVPSYAASFGLKAEKRLQPNLILESGLLYGYRSYKIDNFGILPVIIDPLSSFIDINSISDEIEFHRVAIPINLKYGLTSKWFVTVGMEIDFYLKKERIRTISKLDTPSAEELLDVDQGLKTFPIAANLAFNRKFFGKKITSEASLFFNYNFNEIEIPRDTKSNQQLNIGLGFVIWL